MADKFHHPYTPYDVQIEFMQSVWDCCEHGLVGILESPTGTGKSLSLICGSLSWLRDHKRRRIEGEVSPATSADDDTPDWMLAYEKQNRQQKARDATAALRERLARARRTEERMRTTRLPDNLASKRKRGVSDNTFEDELAQFALDEYESDTEKKTAEPFQSSSTLSAETMAMLDRLGAIDSTETKPDLSTAEDDVQIVFCSRTHSQLRQFTDELRKFAPPSSVRHDPEDKVDHESIRQLTLGSRKNLCINPRVASLRDATSINERCLELQKPGTAAESKCSFLPNDRSEALQDFQDATIAKLRDIEDLARIGKTLSICPYYASRSVLPLSEIITLPYPLLLQKEAREALGLSLKGRIVIIDEAHNLMDTLTALYSTDITLGQVQNVRAQLRGYLQKFRNRLKGKNRVYLAQLLRIVESMIDCMQTLVKATASADGQMQPSDLLRANGVDQINIAKILQYIAQSKLAYKVEAYSTWESEQNEADKAGQQHRHPSRSTTPALMHLQSFLHALSNPALEGRFFYSRSITASSSDLTVKYQLLDATAHFADLVNDARAVILAGGTMSPMSDYTSHLLSYLPSNRIRTLSCNHVIPTHHLTVVTHARTLSGHDFDFTYARRNDSIMLSELGGLIVRLSILVPDGLVIFLPSYSFLDFVLESWKKSDIYDRISEQKKIFTERTPNVSEAKPSATQQPRRVEETLKAYSEHIHAANRAGNGALLFAVVGGSLSEGINFSDRLGRGVVVVGLPFPNAQSSEWKAKMQHVQSRSNDANAAREYYENACMRAVNQSIGRAIRHKGDYAAIVLVDRRYETPRIREKLPKWMQASMASGVETEAGMMSHFKSFFKQR